MWEVMFEGFGMPDEERDAIRATLPERWATTADDPSRWGYLALVEGVPVAEGSVRPTIHGPLWLAGGVTLPSFGPAGTTPSGLGPVRSSSTRTSIRRTRSSSASGSAPLAGSGCWPTTAPRSRRLHPSSRPEGRAPSCCSRPASGCHGRPARPCRQPTALFYRHVPADGLPTRSPTSDGRSSARS